jgi:hypothetical protein
MSASINGYLTLGTGVSGGLVVPPPANAGYSPQPVSFTTFTGGVTLNGVTCVFGPVTAPWGTLTTFGVVDLNGNPVQPPGTLQSPFTPLVGQLVTVPQGNISIVVGSQFTAAPGCAGGGETPTTGPLTSGSVTLTSGSYSLVLASGARAALVLSNVDQANAVRMILGGASAPASGASGYSLIPPYGSWPPPGMGEFTSSDAVWAMGTTSSVSGQMFNYLVAGVPVTPVPPLPGATVSGTVSLSASGYVQVLPAMVRDVVLLTNADQANTVRVLLGGSAPASGALGYSLIPPFGSWPPPGLGDFVPDDAIWALGTANGQVLNTLYATPSPPGSDLPIRGPTASGSIALASGSYSLVLPSAYRNTLLLTNANQTNTIRVILGGQSAPASGALGYSLIPPFGHWPPAGFGDFVPDDAIWAIGTVQGQILNYLTG